jgi:hypothetical protein
MRREAMSTRISGRLFPLIVNFINAWFHLSINLFPDTSVTVLIQDRKVMKLEEHF